MNAVTTETAQLVSRTGEVATLQSVQIEGHLDGLLLTMTTRQHYKNKGETNLEAVYTFPLPWSATLLGLNAEIDGHRLQGTVLERKEATERYEKAIDEGDTPIMVERSARGIYTANLGNLKPGESAVIEIVYAQLLRFEQDQIRITVPTTVAPRYGDEHQTGGLAPHESVEASLLVEYPLTVKITLTGEMALAGVQCPNHTVVTAPHKDALVVTLEQGAFLDRDFVLLLQGLQGKSFVTVAPDGEQFAVLASFCPQVPQHKPEPLLLKILVDCSGSMGGDSIASARRALHQVMQEMNELDWVSYSRFGSQVKHELSGLQPCNSATIKQIAKLVDFTDADLGGTEMNAALISTFELGMTKIFKVMFAKSEIQSHSRDVLLITDGDIWNVEAVIQLAQQSGHRIFAIGVGSAPAESLLREVAEKSGGACELVSLNQDVAEVIVRMFRRMRSVRCTDVKLDWGQSSSWQSALPKAIYGGDTLHLCARLDSLPTAPPVLSWNVEDKPMQSTADQIQKQSGKLLSRMVAAQQIEQLMQLTPMKNTLPRSKGTGDKATSKLALTLALHYQLVTDQTNLLLVHIRDEGQKAEGLPTLDKVAHMQAAGWGGLGSVASDFDQPMFSRIGASIGAYSVGHSVRESSAPSYSSMSTPSVWRTRDRTQAAAMVDALARAPVQTVTPLELLETFDKTSQKMLASYRFERILQALNLSQDLKKLLEDFTVILGDSAKAWAVLIQWLAEQLSYEITLSRHSERLLRHVLKDTDAKILNELRQTLTASSDAIMNTENVAASLDDQYLDAMEIPAFLRKQAD